MSQTLLKILVGIDKGNKAVKFLISCFKLSLKVLFKSCSFNSQNFTLSDYNKRYFWSFVDLNGRVFVNNRNNTIPQEKISAFFPS